jgi:acetyl esterase/lipase
VAYPIDWTSAATTAGTSITLTVPTRAQVGDLLVVQVAVPRLTTITAPSGWTLVDGPRDAASNVRAAIYSRFVQVGDPATWDWTFASSNAALTCAVVRGADPTTPIPASSVTTNTGTGGSSSVANAWPAAGAATSRTSPLHLRFIAYDSPASASNAVRPNSFDTFYQSRLRWQGSLNASTTNLNSCLFGELARTSVAAPARTLSWFRTSETSGNSSRVYVTHTVPIESASGESANPSHHWFDVTYTTSPTTLLCDFYFPHDRPGPWPVCVFVYGGGWSGGTKNNNALNTAAHLLLRRGIAVAALNYRLSGVAPWPGMAQDTKGFIRWLRANLATYNLRDRIGLFGWSAGGQIALVTALTPGKASLTSSSHGNTGQSEAVDAVLAWHPHAHSAFIDSELTALSISPRGGGIPNACGTTGPEATVLGNGLGGTGATNPCSLARFDGGTPDTSENLYNLFSTAYWATGGRHTCASSLPIRISHAVDDNQIPYLQSWNDGTGAGAGLPDGLVQRLRAQGFGVTWTQYPVGCIHGYASAGWAPSIAPVNVAPALVDADVQWLADVLNNPPALAGSAATRALTTSRLTGGR